MEVIGDAKDIATPRPFAVAIPSKQGIVLMSRDSPSGSMHSRSEMPLCPAYRICRQSRGPYRSPMLDSHHDQQITTLRDSLQAIKEAARLIQLIANDIKKRQDADPWMRYPDLGYERIKQSPSPGSGLIATTSSVCALCGVALQLKDSSEKSRKFVIDKEKHDDHDFLSRYFDINNILKMAHKVPSPAKKAKNSDNFPITESVFDYILPKENPSIDKRAKGQEKVSSKTQSADTSESRSEKPKLLFIRQTPSGRITYETRQEDTQRSASQMPKYVSSNREYKTSDLSNHCIVNISSTTTSSMQDASTFTQDVLCPCACGLLVRDGIESEVSINPMPTLKDKLVKTKLEELSFHLESREISHTKVHDDATKITKTKTQKLRKDIKVKSWIEEIVQLRLQTQIEELHKKIQFFKRENEYIRHLAQKCRCLSKDIQGLPTKDTYSEFTTTIQHLHANYHNEHGIIATLVGMFRGSINLQQIATRLLAPFLEHWSPRDNTITTGISSAPGAKASPTPSSRVFNVY